MRAANIDATVAFWVPGHPVGKGDHTAGKTKAGRLFLRARNASALTGWTKTAALSGMVARGPRPLLDCPVRAHLVALYRRPRAHYGTGRNGVRLRADAPAFPHAQGRHVDLDKVARALGDAMKRVVWADDVLVTTWLIARRWGDSDGIWVVVEPEPSGPEFGVITDHSVTVTW